MIEISKHGNNRLTSSQITQINNSCVLVDISSDAHTYAYIVLYFPYRYTYIRVCFIGTVYRYVLFRGTIAGDSCSRLPTPPTSIPLARHSQETFPHRLGLSPTAPRWLLAPPSYPPPTLLFPSSYPPPTLLLPSPSSPSALCLPPSAFVDSKQSLFTAKWIEQLHVPVSNSQGAVLQLVEQHCLPLDSSGDCRTHPHHTYIHILL